MGMFEFAMKEYGDVDVVVCYFATPTNLSIKIGFRFLTQELQNVVAP